MAGPNDPTTPVTPTNVTFAAPSQDEIERLTTYEKGASNTTTALNGLNAAGGLVSNVLGALNTKLAGVGASFESLTGMTDETAAKFGVITTSVLGATEAFKGLTGVDTTRLVTFKGQIDDLMKILQQAPGTKMAGDALEAWGAKMRNAGFGADRVAAAVRGLKSGVTDAALAMVESADNVLRLQESFMQLTIQGSGSNALFGEISKTINGLGSDFQNLNDVTTRYSNVLQGATVALGGNQELAAEYMAQINRMPGGLKALLGPTTGVLEGTNLLTDAIHLATGAGRTQKEVFEDMSKAMTEYGTSGTDALRFSARMTEVADSLGAQVKDVQSALHDSADAFKMFVTNGADASKMTQGMADAMKNYVGELTSVGVPAQNAIEMFRNYTGVMKNMTLGQQAFVSSMSGGPGGLRGAFAMDAAMKKGDFEGIRRQVEATIRKMTGPIVSLDEAQKSEGAAAQYTRQIQLLQNGPLGAMAKTRPEAEALLQAMKEGGKLPTTGKGADASMLETMNHGEKWQEKSYTELTKILSSIRNLGLMAGQANEATLGRAAGTSGILGRSATGVGIMPGQQERMRSYQETAKRPMTNADVLRSAGGTLAESPTAMKDMATSIIESMGGNAPKFSDVSEYTTAGKRVGRSIPSTTTATTGTQDTTARGMHATNAAHIGGGGGQQPIPVVLASGSAIHVNFTGVCPHCGKDVHTTEVARTTSPQAFGAGF